MHTVTVTRQMSHSPKRVWTLLADFANTYVYHPIVAESASTNNQDTGLGAARYCQMYDGNRVEEKIVDWDPAARRYLVQVTEHGPFPLTHMTAEVRVEAQGDGSQVSYHFEFTPKFGPMGWVMAKLALEKGFTKLGDQLLEGIDQHLSTGRLIEQDGALGAAA